MLPCFHTVIHASECHSKISQFQVSKLEKKVDEKVNKSSWIFEHILRTEALVFSSLKSDFQYLSMNPTYFHHLQTEPFRLQNRYCFI